MNIQKRAKDFNTKMDEIAYALVQKLQEILKHERGHFAFYLQALMVVRGPSRLYVKPLFEKEMQSELEHIRQFGDKLVALGHYPDTDVKYVDCGGGLRGWLTTPELIQRAVDMERDVLALYNEVYPLAEEYGTLVGDMSVALLLEENIEHTTEDVEELEKLLVVDQPANQDLRYNQHCSGR